MYTFSLSRFARGAVQRPTESRLVCPMAILNTATEIKYTALLKNLKETLKNCWCGCVWRDGDDTECTEHVELFLFHGLDWQAPPNATTSSSTTTTTTTTSANTATSPDLKDKKTRNAVSPKGLEPGATDYSVFLDRFMHTHEPPTETVSGSGSVYVYKYLCIYYEVTMGLPIVESTISSHQRRPENPVFSTLRHFREVATWLRYSRHKYIFNGA